MLQSVERVIPKEIQRTKKTPIPPASEPVGNVQKDSEMRELSFPRDSGSQEIREPENEIRDLQITNKSKDIVIEQMQKERDRFIDQSPAANRKVEELETKLLQPESPDAGAN